MPGPTKINLRASGLHTSPNQLDVPEGGLTEASNIIIQRDNVVQSMRGFKLYGDAADSAIKQLLSYKRRLLRHVGTTLEWDTQELNSDNESEFEAFSGTFTETQEGLRIKGIEANGNFYFTTAEGIQKISAQNADEFTTAANYIIPAGAVKAINASAYINLELGNTTGFLPGNSTVAYRIVWGYRDANKNLILGTPSERVVVYNPLMGFLVPDFDRLLGALDDITDTATTAFIGDGDYVSSLKLEIDATPPELQTQIIALAEKIDSDILYGDVATVAPLDIDQVSLSSGGIAEVTFNSGDPTDYFVEGSKIFIAGLTTTNLDQLNGNWSLTEVDPSFIRFTIPGTVTSFVAAGADATMTIVSYEYRGTIADVEFNDASFDLNTIIVNNPATDDQLKIMQQAISQIITRLQNEPDTVISAMNKTTYIDVLEVTTSTNVILNINIPEGITSVYFFQIYRSNISQATGTTVLSDLSPDDEMKQVYEAFPTSAELAAEEIVVEDVVIDGFRGANLYTNPATGEGIAQANDIPPVSKDINNFKNVTFYANTQTRQRLNIDLLGVQNFLAGNISSVSSANPAVITTDTPHELSTGDIVYINGTGLATMDTKVFAATVTGASTFTIPVSGAPGVSIGYWSNSMFAVINSSSTNQYYFIKGMAEVTNIATIADTAGSLAGDYFTLNSPLDRTEYYVWYKVSGSGSDPAISGKTGIQVNVITNDSADDVAAATRNELSLYPQNWSISGSTNNIIVTNVLDGVTTNATVGTSGFTITFPQQGRGELDSANEILLSSSVSPAIALEETARSLQNVINKNASEDIYVYYLSGLGDVPGKMLFEGRSLSADQFSLLANNALVGESFNPPITPSPTTTLTNTIANPTVITVASHGLVSGNTVLIAFSNSTPLINGEKLVTRLSSSTFSVPVNVTVAGTSGVMLNKANAASSDNEDKQNRVYYSKLQQPEAVPILNYFDVGAQSSAILRIFPLRDSLFIFKEDGLYRISGEAAPFTLALFDGSTSMRAPDSLGLSNNFLYIWSESGINIVSESGVELLSRDIDVDILPLASAGYPNFSKVTWGVGYDSENCYIVYTNSTQTDEVATIGYRYSNLTNSWTTIDRSTTCGIVNPDDDKLYMGAGYVNFIEQERKSFDRTDYANRQYQKSLEDNSFFSDGELVKLNSVTNVTEGDVLYQEQWVTVTNFNNLLLNIDNDPAFEIPIVGIGLDAGTDHHSVITVKRLTFLPGAVDTGTETITVPNHEFVDGQKVRFLNAGTLPSPLVADTDYIIDNASTNTFQLLDSPGGALINFASGGVGTTVVYLYHNLQVGDTVIITDSTSFPSIDGSHVVTVITNGFTYQIVPAEPVQIGGFGATGLSRLSYLDSLFLSGGDNIRDELEDLAERLDTDPGTQYNDYLSQIESKNGTISSNTAADPTVITTGSPHELVDERIISIASSNSVPDIDGKWEVTPIGASTFSIDEAVLVAGSAGTWVTDDDNFLDLKACFNAVVSNLNIDPGPISSSYVEIDFSTPLEAVITSVDTFTMEVTVSPGLDWLVGSMTSFEAIETEYTYCPETMGDSFGYKHLSTFTMMFQNKAFTQAVISFASDLLPEFIEVPFPGDGNGIFGIGDNFGGGFFGGNSHGAPFRTYFPRNVMRCRYVLIKFRHRVAREKYAVFGVTLEGSIGQSSRAYR